MKKLLMAMVLMPMMALAYTEIVDGVAWTYSIVDNQSIIEEVPFDVAGSITTPRELGGCCVTGIGEDAFWYHEDLTSVRISAGVTSIGRCAFEGCTSLETVTIPPSVKQIGWGAFDSCDNLNAIVVENGNRMYCSESGFLYDKAKSRLIRCPGGKKGPVEVPMGVMGIESHAFAFCYGVTSVSLPSGVRDIGTEAFYDCENLSSVSLPSSIVRIGESAFGNTKLPCADDGLVMVDGCLIGYEFRPPTRVVIPDGVRLIAEGALSWLADVESLEIPSSVEKIGDGAFYGCSGLQSVTLPKCVKSLPDAFPQAYAKISNVVLCEGMTRIEGWAFAGCAALESVKIPEGVTEIGDYAFSGCGKLASVSIPESVTRMGSSVFDGTKLAQDQWGKDMVVADGYLMRYRGNCPKSVVIPDGIRFIGGSAFYRCTELESITIPQSVRSIGESAFYGCTELRSVKIPEGVISIGKLAFSSCEELTSVTIPESVMSIGSSAFSDTKILNDYADGLVIVNDCLIGYRGSCPDRVVIPDGVRIVGGGVFSGGGLSSVVIPPSVRSIGENAFFWCKELRSVEIPSSVISIGYEAFTGCDQLLEISVAEQNPAYSSLEGVLYDKDRTELICWPGGKQRWASAIIPPGVKRIGKGAFEYCLSVKSVSLPPSVESIDEWAFYYCERLKVITMPPNVTSIGGNAFDYCRQLEVIHVGGGGCIEKVYNLFDSLHYEDDGMDFDRLTFDYAETPLYDFCTVKFDAQGGDAGVWSQDVILKGETIANLPHAEWENHKFLGWFTSAIGGEKVTAATVVEEDATFFARWEGLGDWSVVPGEKVTIDTGLIGYTASGLPSGLKYDKTTGLITGSASKPTAAEGVVVKFTKKGFETEELTIVVTAIPKVTVAMEGVNSPSDTDGCKVTGAGAYLVGKKVTLKATAPKGVVFMGWFDDEGVVATQNSYSFTMDKEDVALVAKFKKEVMSVGCEGLSAKEYLPAGVAGAEGGIALDISTESGVKSVKVDKLPSGMKYDSKTGLITGAPTKAGDNTVVITVTAVSGAVEKREIKVSVAAMPVMVVGKFDGFVSVGEDNLGTFTLTTTDAGKLTAKVITAAGTVSFSGTCWDAVEKGIYRATLTTKKGEKLTLTLDSTAAWDENQLSGEFTTAAIAETKKTAAVSPRTYSVSAQRNAFGKTWYFAATGDETTGWKLAYTEDTKGAALTVTLKADGTVSIAGKLPNGTDTKGKAVTFKVSASGYANVGGLKDGAILADFAPVLTVNKVKKVLMIETNLWFDRKNEVGRDIGQAKFVE